MTDIGKRISDHHNFAMTVGQTGHYLAFRLSDGSHDGQIYDTWRDAVDHQLHDTQSMYVQINPLPMTEHEADELLRIHRTTYDAGFRLVDPATVFQGR